jgi:hypothetical protein
MNTSPNAAQLWVTAGPVNITNIAVDGGNGLAAAADQISPGFTTVPARRALLRTLPFVTSSIRGWE